jgi:hypothetical protein
MLVESRVDARHDRTLPFLPSKRVREHVLLHFLVARPCGRRVTSVCTSLPRDKTPWGRGQLFLVLVGASPARPNRD